ncbi:hypothetical protein BDN71DRAFT_1432015 [Pleurotus eryngii]|uniref:Uncharacterized protein n=1 Tax=Pleurotus eryngii TaxID=5323 RepID=A0A9P5ZVT6_PLEER|nr:hypothetical protein BDN71DRAFT_1432015 [Pleurotus eryngii]
MVKFSGPKANLIKSVAEKHPQVQSNTASTSAFPISGKENTSTVPLHVYFWVIASSTMKKHKQILHSLRHPEKTAHSLGIFTSHRLLTPWAEKEYLKYLMKHGLTPTLPIRLTNHLITVDVVGLRLDEGNWHSSVAWSCIVPETKLHLQEVLRNDVFLVMCIEVFQDAEKIVLEKYKVVPALLQNEDDEVVLNARNA